MILATCLPSASLRAEAAEVGIDYVLSKPIRQRMLIARILDLATGRSSANAAGAVATGPPVDAAAQALRVLVVDDLAVNRQLAAAMLTKAGYAVTLAADGAQAIDMIKAGDYDLVLMDVQMPRMSGIATTAIIRTLPGRSATVPIIAMTASAMDGDREALIAAGMNDYIAKPFSLVQLTGLVERWAQRLGQRRERRDYIAK